MGWYKKTMRKLTRPNSHPNRVSNINRTSIIFGGKYKKRNKYLFSRRKLMVGFIKIFIFFNYFF